MDLNLYLGLPRRRRHRESDLGSDLSLMNSASLSPEMSNNQSIQSQSQSQGQSFPSISQLGQQEGEMTIPHDALHDLEYNPYLLSSYGQDSETLNPVLGEPQTLVVVGDDHHPPYLADYVESAHDSVSTEAMVLGGSSSNNNDVELLQGSSNNNLLEYVPYPTSTMMSYVSGSPLLVAQQTSGLEVLEEESNAHVPYITSLPTMGVNNSDSSSTRAVAEGSGFCPFQDGAPEGGSFQRVLLQCPEFRFRRLIEANRRLGFRRFRTGVDGSELGAEHEFSDSRDAEGSGAVNGVMDKGNVERVIAEELEEGEGKDLSVGAAGFDCNVCLEVAREPVVTSCGHLFCWPCLYQWLHLHSDHKECPVCKGEVIESTITPIYGRGSSEKEVNTKEGDEEQGNSSLKIPPRPHARRYESLRQRFRRPLLRRLREEIGSWRFLLDEEMHRQVEDLEERNMAPASVLARRAVTRAMATRLPREGSLESGLNLEGSGPSNTTPVVLDGDIVPDGLHGLGSRSTPPALARRGVDFWRRFASYSFPSDRLAAIAADLSNMVGGRRANSGSNPGASASTSVTPPVPDPVNVQPLESAVAADQASASSTIAVIQGDSGHPIDATSELDNAGTSRLLRRRRRNAAPGSLDVDGVHPASKRRRLN
ncbi:hypothetical protein Sjap_004089 [Stephania japonica]|uniref:E3 ubiquitin-protein ligase RMA n=1 Tax=Stephania japonica TaxID=461633 RepID=A0AAP0K1U8_9MAGN